MQRRHALLLLAAGLAIPTPLMASHGLRALAHSERIRVEEQMERLARAWDGFPITLETLETHGRIRIPAALLFKGDTLSVDGVRLLSRFAEEMHRQPWLDAEIAAHHYGRTSSHANYIEAARRAVAVVAALQSRKVPAARLTHQSFGDREPLRQDAMSGWEPVNRIEILTHPLPVPGAQDAG